MPDWIIQISTIVTAFATLIYMIFTGWLIWETKKGREMQERPQIDIYIQRAQDWGNKIELLIENNGFTGAYDIKLECEQDFQCFSSNKDAKHNNIKNWGPFAKGIPFLPPRGTRNYTLTIISDNFEEKMKTELIITAKYKDSHNKKYQFQFPIRFNEFENTLLPIKDPRFKIAKSLENLNKDVHRITTGWAKIFTVNQTKKQLIEENKKALKESQRKK